jgi:hypothetical protein
MIKKMSFMFVMATLVMTTSCKKEETSSATDLNTVNQEANIGSTEQTAVQAPKPIDGKYPVMNFSKTEHDFGVIKQGDRVDYSFKFENTGEADLIITDAKGSCGCTVPEYPKEPVKPGESGEIKVSFNSAAKSGQQSKSVTITCNTEKGAEHLTIKSTIKVPEGNK